MSALSAVCRQEYYLELGNSMPPILNGTPDEYERRCWVALEAFHDLRPGNANEGRLAMRIVLCGAHAVECLREVGVYRKDFARMHRCRAQAASLMREERAARRILAQEQKLRLALEAAAGGVPEKSVLPPPPAHLVALATPAPAAPPRVQAEAAPPTSAPTPSTATPSTGEPPGLASRTTPAKPRQSDAAPPPSAEAIKQAEAYAREHFEVAAILRHDHGISPLNEKELRGATLPADPVVMDALIRGTSRPLILLDAAVGDFFDKAA